HSHMHIHTSTFTQLNNYKHTHTHTHSSPTNICINSNNTHMVTLLQWYRHVCIGSLAVLTHKHHLGVGPDMMNRYVSSFTPLVCVCVCVVVCVCVHAYMRG